MCHPYLPRTNFGQIRVTIIAVIEADAALTGATVVQPPRMTFFFSRGPNAQGQRLSGPSSMIVVHAVTNGVNHFCSAATSFLLISGGIAHDQRDLSAR